MAKLLLLTTKRVILVVPAFQVKLHALRRAQGLNYNPHLLPFTWNIFGAKMDEKETASRDMHAKVLITARWRPDCVNMWQGQWFNCQFYTYIHKVEPSLCHFRVDSSGPVKGTTVNHWMAWNIYNGSSSHTRHQHHFKPPAALKPEDKRRRHSCCRQEL